MSHFVCMMHLRLLLLLLVFSTLVSGEPRLCLRGGGGKRGARSVHLGDVSAHRAQSVALMKALQTTASSSLTCSFNASLNKNDSHIL